MRLPYCRPSDRRCDRNRRRCYVPYGVTWCVPQSPPPSSRLAGIGRARRPGFQSRRLPLLLAGDRGLHVGRAAVSLTPEGMTG
jgi:hypothetical protein